MILSNTCARYPAKSVPYPLRRREFVGMSHETLAALMREQRIAPGAVREEGPGWAGAMHGLWREQARPVRAGDA